MRQLEDDRRRADRCSGLKPRSRTDRMPRIPPSGMDMLPHERPKTPAAYADLVEPASLLVLDATNLYRDIVQEARGRRELSRRHPSSGPLRGVGSVIRPASPSLI